jgi:RHS repeat-associated protein
MFGYQRDDESDYKLLGSRYYDPEIGRFLTRDPIKDGRNWYAYCQSDPVSSSDPSGLTKIVLVWYHVFLGGHHAGILIIDNRRGGTQPIYSFAGGPEKYGLWGNGLLESKSGPWQPRTQDYDELGGKWDGSGIVLVNDDSAAEPWIKLLKMHEADMKSENQVGYDPAPGLFEEQANSNSWSRELIDRGGLRKQYDAAVDKRGGTPWVPGWGKDPWPNG